MPGAAISMYDGFSVATSPAIRSAFTEDIRSDYDGLLNIVGRMTDYHAIDLLADDVSCEVSMSFRNSETDSESNIDSGDAGFVTLGSGNRRELLERRFQEGLETVVFALILPRPEELAGSFRQTDRLLASQLGVLQAILKFVGHNERDKETAVKIAGDAYGRAKETVVATSTNPATRRERLAEIAGQYPGNRYLFTGLQKAAIQISGQHNTQTGLTSGGDAHDAFVHGGATGLDFVTSYVKTYTEAKN